MHTHASVTRRQQERGRGHSPAAARFVPGGLTESTRRTLSGEAADAAPARLAGLILGSPEFQRR